MARIVQKYGGTSVSDIEKIFNVAKRVANTRARGIQVAVVVSAMGDTTDELLELAGRLPPGRGAETACCSTGELVSAALLSCGNRLRHRRLQRAAGRGADGRQVLMPKFLSLTPGA